MALRWHNYRPWLLFLATDRIIQTVFVYFGWNLYTVPWPKIGTGAGRIWGWLKVGWSNPVPSGYALAAAVALILFHRIRIKRLTRERDDAEYRARFHQHRREIARQELSRIRRQMSEVEIPVIFAVSPGDAGGLLGNLILSHEEWLRSEVVGDYLAAWAATDAISQLLATRRSFSPEAFGEFFIDGFSDHPDRSRSYPQGIAHQCGVMVRHFCRAALQTATCYGIERTVIEAIRSDPSADLVQAVEAWRQNMASDPFVAAVAAIPPED